MTEQMQSSGPVDIQQAAEAGARRYAGFWIRVGAMLIDMIILIVLGRILGIIPLIGWILGFAASIAYYIYFIGTSGQTPGKMACGIKVINADGSDLDFQKAFMRLLGYFISFLTIGIGFIIAAFDEPEKKALHDRIFETRVIYVR